MEQERVNTMPEKIRPIDANALARKIREYMSDFPNATALLTACQVILSMLGDENQTPTLSGFTRDTNVPSKGEPLTLEQLRKMDGKPVYFERGKSWGIVSVDSNGRWEGVPFFVTCKDGVNFIHNIKLRKMKVYAYPPARIDQEKWEPCEWCGEWMLGDCRPKEQDAGYKLYAGYCKQVAADDFFEDETEELNYCPRCGRPLTPEAWEELERRVTHE